jgi:hypothetical protein
MRVDIRMGKHVAEFFKNPLPPASVDQPVMYKCSFHKAYIPVVNKGV